MALATDSRPSRNSLSSAQALERRLLLSHLAVFATAFVLAALVVRVAFIVNVNRDTFTRLQVLARAGLRTAVFKGADLAVDPTDIANSRALLLGEQGLEWFDVRGRLLAAQGDAPSGARVGADGYGQLTIGNQTFSTVSIAVLNPKTLQRVGTVRASEPAAPKTAQIRGFDSGLLIAAFLAIMFSGLAGWVLTRRAVAPAAKSFESMRLFTADASHELRSPLAAITSNTDAALRDDAPLSASIRSRFEAIGDAAAQMTKLTDDLLLLASAEHSLEDELFVVDMSSLVDRVTQRFAERLAEKHIRFAAHIEPAITAYGNPDQIERILANLLENAVRYTGSSGSVSVSCKLDRGHISVAVRDTGIGIADEDLALVFDRFWRADSVRSREGTGLGLAIARALARRHGGDVVASSELGAWSEFVIFLPTRPRVVE